MARPTKYTPATADEIVAGIAVGLTDKDAALAAGISEATLARWRERYADFDDRLMRARAQRSRLWLRKIGDLAAAGDLRAYTELLDRCSPDYRKTERHEHSGPGGKPIRHDHRDLSAFTDDQIERMAEVAAEVAAGRREP